MSLGKFIKKVGKGLGQAVNAGGRGLSTVSRGISSGIRGIEKIADKVADVPIVGPMAKAAYEASPIKEVVDVVRKPAKDILRISERAGTTLSDLSRNPRDKTNIDLLKRDVRSAYGIGRDTYGQLQRMRK